jgi:membrane magnesium transporter 1
MGKLLLCIGLAGLCHAAFSATQHRKYLRLSERDFTSLPTDILAQTLFSLFLCSISCVLGVANSLKKIHITSEWETKCWDNIASRTSFYSFNHRGKYLFAEGDYDIDDETSKENELRKRQLLKKRLEQQKQQQQSQASNLKQRTAHNKPEDPSSEEDEEEDDIEGNY